MQKIQGRDGLKTRLLACGAMGALVTAVALSAPAFAQDATQASGTEVTTANQAPVTETNKDGTVVVVTGIRRGIESAINVKKRSDDIVEAVSAEDIGKLPDQSIAESIARLPGVAAQRLDGRAQEISVRGLGPDFTSALLNGREQVSSNNNRSVEFDQYPAELLSGVEIYKTPDAGLVSQGMAGTVDLQTIRPLAYGKRTFALNVRGESESLGALNAGTKATGNRESFMYVDQFLNKTLGVAIGYAHMESPQQAEKYNAWGYANDATGAYILGGAKPYVQSDDLKRDGLMGTIEWKPTDQLHSTVDLYYSTFQNTEILRGIELGLAEWGGNGNNGGIGVSNEVINNNLVTSYTASGVKGVVRNDEDARNDTLKAVGWNIAYTPNDKWTLAADLSHSDIHRTDVVLENYSGTGPGANNGQPGTGATDTLNVTMLPNGGFTFHSTTGLNYADPNAILITSSQGWGGTVTDYQNGNTVYPYGQMGYYNRPRTIDALNAIKLSAKRVIDNSFVDSMEFGVNANQRTKDLINDEYFLELPGGVASMKIPTAAIVGSTSLSFIGLGSMISYDPMYLINHHVYNLVANVSADVSTKSWHVEEKVTTAYAKFNINSKVGDVPLTGNFGLQYVYADQSSTAVAGASSASNPIAVPVAGGAKYGDWLPSMNLNFHLADDQALRLGVARTEARPRMDQMDAAVEYSFNSGNCANATCSNATTADLTRSPWSGGGGNPTLKPYLADNYDLSWEKYFGRKGYISFAVFDKEIKTWVFDVSKPYNFSGFQATAGYNPTITQGLVTIPENISGGYIRGEELSVNVPLNMVSPWLDGFGIQSSFSLTNSRITNPNGGGAIEIPGFSHEVDNTTIYFEKWGFSARVSDRHRSKYLAEINGFGNGLTEVDAEGESVVDAQIGYEIQSGPMKGVNFLLQADNITNAPFTTFSNGDKRQTLYYQKYGSNYLFGASYKF